MLGWEPKISFKDLVSEMINEDMKLAKKELLLYQNDHDTKSNQK